MNLSNLTFDYGWRKPIKLHFNGNDIDIELVFDAYEGEEINTNQINAYQQFLQNKQHYESKVEYLLKQHVITNGLQGAVVKPSSLQFDHNGSFALFCECDWDIENGIAIVLHPKEHITTQNNFL